MGRLIDETELEKYIMHDGCEKGCEYIDERDLKYIPTVEAIPKADLVDILDRVRAEIADLSDADAYGDYQQGFNFGLMRAAQILDKYKAKQEGT